MWYSFGRFFIEGLRTDSLYFLGVIRISQLLSAVLFVGTLILFIWRRKKGNLPDYDRSLGKKINKLSDFRALKMKKISGVVK